MSRPSALGRGLSALLGDVAPREEGEAVGGTRGADVRLLPVDALTPHGDQPRRRFDEAALEELTQSIAARGVIQPIVVRPRGSRYQIVAGERRWRAAQRARLAEVPVVVRDYDDAETLQIALLENIQRQDLNAIEEARAYHRLADLGRTQDEIARTVHKSRSHVANLLRLLDLPEPVQDRVVEGALSMGHARALLGAADVEGLAEQVASRGLSVRDTEKLARAAKGRADAPRPRRPAQGEPEAAGEANADLAELERQLADLLGVTVRIALGEEGGALTLSFASLDQLDMLCQRLTGEGI